MSTEADSSADGVAPAPDIALVNPSSAKNDSIAPPPDPRAFAPKRSNRDVHLERSLRSRRTFIPILLTLGMLLPAIASLKWLMPLSPFGELSAAMVAVMAIAGACLLVVALLNMLQVRDLLHKQR